MRGRGTDTNLLIEDGIDIEIETECEIVELGDADIIGGSRHQLSPWSWSLFCDFCCNH